ncbi:hypothetical protein [Comamonas terrigena]|uniref:hypothetical protein n=1 Tax=Comamonas terrigena TaxID=32013 RepID=UPI0028A65275|nr:hypothetical protein [Comamonas terrigena]
MAQLPDYVTMLLDDAGEEFDPGVVKSEMERGLPKMRVGTSRVVVSVSAALLFDSAEDAGRFETWYFNDIRRIGFFDWVDPRTGTVRTGRFKDGAIGKLVPTIAGYAQSKRSVTLEYLR